MKKTIILFPLIFIIVGFTVNRLIDKKAEEILRQLDITEDYAQTSIFSNLSSGSSFWFPNVRNLKGIAAGERSAYVQVIGDYVKNYTSSEDFVKKYNEYREMKKPTEPEKPKTAAQMKQEYKDNLQKSIVESENNMSQMPAESKPYLEESIKMMKEQLKQIDDPNNTMFSPDMDKIMEDSYKQQMEMYNQQVAEWEKEYPVNNPKGMIKVWLNSFLDLSKDIDFNAKLAEEKNGRKLFVNQDYERKNSTWKLCFRSGKETVETARKFAQSWLSEMK